MARTLAVLVLIAALSVAPEVGAAHDPAFATTPTSAAVGDEIFFNGSNCPDSGGLVDGTVHFLDEAGRGSSANQVAAFEVSSDGVFAGTFRVPEVAPGLDYEVQAICFSTGATPFGSVRFQVQDYETPTGPPPSSPPVPQPGLLGAVVPDAVDEHEPASSRESAEGAPPPSTASPTTEPRRASAPPAAPMPAPSATASEDEETELEALPTAPGPTVLDPELRREWAFTKLRETFVDLRRSAIDPLLQALRPG